MITASEFLTQLDGCELHGSGIAAAPIEGLNPLDFIAMINDIRQTIVLLQAAWDNPSVQAAAAKLYELFKKIAAKIGWQVPEPAPDNGGAV